VAKKPRNILKLKTSEQLANGESISEPMRATVRNTAPGA
jgi:hypothetical protein